MNKSETLLLATTSTSPVEEPIIMTVGNSSDSYYYYGYDKDGSTTGHKIMGTLNKIPYWLGDDGYFVLSAIADYKNRGNTEAFFGLYYSGGGTPSSKQIFNIKCTCVTTGKSITFSGEWSTSGYLVDDSYFEFPSMYNKSVELTFDPPPDGFL